MIWKNETKNKPKKIITKFALKPKKINKIPNKYRIGLFPSGIMRFPHVFLQIIFTLIRFVANVAFYS